jgi:hypothetical protein
MRYDYIMSSYDDIRIAYKPDRIKVLLIAESQPPAASVQSSRHFYRSDQIRKDDRLYTNTIRALYPETAETTEEYLEQNKEQWLRRFQSDGWYMIEALPTSLRHEVTKKQRQTFIRDHLPELIDRVKKLVDENTKIILIKSNVFDVATEPLRAAGFTVLNQHLLDYPGHFNQQAYREKLATYAKQINHS